MYLASPKMKIPVLDHGVVSLWLILFHRVESPIDLSLNVRVFTVFVIFHYFLV